MNRLRVLSVLLVLGLAAGACSTSPPERSSAPGDATPSPSAAAPAPQDLMPVVRPPSDAWKETAAANEAACVENAEQRVEMLEPLVIPEKRVEPVTFEAVEAGGERIDETVVPGFVIPEVTVDVGCIIYDNAPAGCLGGATITGFEIPGARIPAVTIPERVLPDGSVQPAETVPAVEVDGVKVDSVSVETRCQVERDGVKPSVLRPSILRPSAARPSILRPSLLQPSASVEVETGDGSTEMLTAPVRTLSPVFVSPAHVSAAHVGVEYLPYEQLESEPEVDVAQGKTSKAYVAPSTVLFDEDQAVLKPTATRALKAIVADLNKTSPRGRITVDGYTDDQGSAQSGLTLSRERAQAVTDWLVTKGNIERSRIGDIHGYGEANPAFPNTTEANMARNRRVVISVTR